MSHTIYKFDLNWPMIENVYLQPNIYNQFNTRWQIHYPSVDSAEDSSSLSEKIPEEFKWNYY